MMQHILLNQEKTGEGEDGEVLLWQLTSGVENRDMSIVTRENTSPLTYYYLLS